MYIDSQISEEYTVNLLCEALQISKATYYNRKLRGKGAQTENQKRRAELLPIIREIYHKNGQIYGAGKIAAVMKDRGHRITERVVASIMHENDMFSMRNCAKTLYLRRKIKSGSRFNKNQQPQIQKYFQYESGKNPYVIRVYGKEKHLKPNLDDPKLRCYSYGSPCWARTSDNLINSQVLYRLS